VSSNRLSKGFITYQFNDTQYEFRNDLSKYLSNNLSIAYRLLCKAINIVVYLILLSLGVAGCSEQPTPYRPPTIAVQAIRPVSATTTATATIQPVETPLPSSTPTCTNSLTYLEDLSLPDGTIVRPGESLDKRWLVENSGTCNWGENYRFKFISGAELNAPIEQALYPARSGAKATLRTLFTAPSEAGIYQSAWQAFDPRGQPFGDPVYIQVTVDAGKP